MNMALIKCDECGKEVSDKAKNCPNCGNPINSGGTSTVQLDPAPNKRRKYRIRLVIFWPILLISAIPAIGWAFSDTSGGAAIFWYLLFWGSLVMVIASHISAFINRP